MSIASFYGGDHKGSVFGRSEEYGPDYHWGQDFKRHPEGTPIPSLSAGTIVLSEKQDGHGWFVSVDSGDGWYWTYSHMDMQGFPVGTTVTLGFSLGSVGSTGQSTGPHVHVQRTRNPRPWLHGTEVDPWPQIAAILATTAGGNIRPIPEKKGPRTMYRAALTGTTRVAYFDSISFRETTDGSVDDNAWGRFVGKPGLSVTQAEWDSYLRVSRENAAKVGVPGGTGGADLTPVLEAIGKVPTAAQNGAAARAAIVKP